MSRGQFALIGAALGAIVVGVFIVAYNSDASALTGGQAIRQHSILLFMAIGAAVGFVSFTFFSAAAEQPKTPAESGPPTNQQEP